jgi:hypothetical protein
MSYYPMPIPSRERALKLGASFLERDLDDMRKRAVAEYARQLPIGTSHEGDLMKAVEWATAAAMLRTMAEDS